MHIYMYGAMFSSLVETTGPCGPVNKEKISGIYFYSSPQNWPIDISVTYALAFTLSTTRHMSLIVRLLVDLVSLHADPCKASGGTCLSRLA